MNPHEQNLEQALKDKQWSSADQTMESDDTHTASRETGQSPSQAQTFLTRPTSLVQHPSSMVDWILNSGLSLAKSLATLAPSSIGPSLSWTPVETGTANEQHQVYKDPIWTAQHGLAIGTRPIEMTFSWAMKAHVIVSKDPYEITVWVAFRRGPGSMSAVEVPGQSWSSLLGTPLAYKTVVVSTTGDRENLYKNPRFLEYLKRDTVVHFISPHIASPDTNRTIQMARWMIALGPPLNWGLTPEYLLGCTNSSIREPEVFWGRVSRFFKRIWDQVLMLFEKLAAD